MDRDEEDSIFDIRSREIAARGLAATVFLFAYFLGSVTAMIGSVLIFMLYEGYLFFVTIRRLSMGSPKKAFLIVMALVPVAVFGYWFLKNSGIR